MTAPGALVDQLRMAGAWLGASWLPRLRDEGFVLAAKTDGDAVTVSAVGGKVEPGESFLAAARREYLEETGTPPPRLTPATAPLLIGGPGRLDSDAEGASVVVRKRPDSAPEGAPDLWIAVFLGVTDRDPVPVEKVPAFLVLTPGDLEALAAGHDPQSPGRVVGRLPRGWPRRTLLRDTVAALACQPGVLRALWHRAPAVADRRAWPPDGLEAPPLDPTT